MAGRFALSILLAACLFHPERAFSQEGAHWDGFGQPAPWIQQPEYGATPPADPAAYSGGYVGHSGYPASHAYSEGYSEFPPEMYGPVADYHGHHGAGPYHGHHHHGHHHLYGRGPAEYFNSPHEENWDDDGPLELFLRTVTRRTWLRVEYLHWTLQKPGSTLLGAPLEDIDNPRDPFPVFLPGTDTQLGTARVADLRDVSLRGTNGVRGTFGMPLAFGELEANIWTLATNSDRFVAEELPSPPIPGSGQFIATSTLVNGQIGRNLELYDESFTARYRSTAWGTGAKVVFDHGNSGEGFQFRPLLGFQYLSVNEDLLQRGVFNAFGTQPDLVSEIESNVDNNMYGPVFGMRAELVHRWFTIGVEPRTMLGLNTYKARVRTDQFRGPADPTVITRDRDTIVAPTFELGLYARVNVNEHLSLSVGYDLLWMSRVSRADRNILYDDRGPLPEPPAVRVRSRRRSMMIDGLTVGGEIRLP